MNLHFQDQDSSSTQSTAHSYSYPDLLSAQLGFSSEDQVCMEYSNSPTPPIFNRDRDRTFGGLNKPSVGIQDFSFQPLQLNYDHSMAYNTFNYAEPFLSSLLPAVYGPHSTTNDAPLLGIPAVRVPLPDLTDEPIYVNAKQYHAIMRRRQYRARLDAQNKLIKARKPYLHESRHLHAIKRARGSGGRFLNTKRVQESSQPMTPSSHGLDVPNHALIDVPSGALIDVPSHAQLNQSRDMHQPEIHQIRNYGEGASNASCSDLSAYNCEDIFLESDFRIHGYPPYIERNTKGYTDGGGG